MVNYDRLTIANQIMPLLLPKSKFQIENGAIVLVWEEFSGKVKKKRWTSRNGSFFPTFRLPTGGTHTTAIAQLVNWVRDKPVLPIQTWEYWCGATVGMKEGDRILPLLMESDYPKEKKCYFCGSQGKSLDWYSFGGKYSGLGCWQRCNPLSQLMEEVQR